MITQTKKIENFRLIFWINMNFGKTNQGIRESLKEHKEII